MSRVCKLILNNIIWLSVSISLVSSVSAEEDERQFERPEPAALQARPGEVKEKDKDIPEHVFRKLMNVHQGAETGIGLPKGILLKTGDLKLSENNHFWFLESKDIILTIEKDSGMVHSIKSLNPSPMDILPPTKNGLSCVRLLR
mgnify:FL=1